MRSVMRLWPIEARLFSIAPRFSFACLAFLAIALGSHVTRVRAANEQATMCLGENLYHEGRGEGRANQYIIALITIARVTDPDPQWPKTICEAIGQNKAFSWVLNYKLATTRDEKEKWEDAQRIALDVLANVWVTYKLPKGWECARYYKRTDGKGVSKASEKYFDTRLFPVGTFGSHTAFQERRGCKHPLPTV